MDRSTFESILGPALSKTPGNARFNEWTGNIGQQEDAELPESLLF